MKRTTTEDQFERAMHLMHDGGGGDRTLDTISKVMKMAEIAHRVTVGLAVRDELFSMLEPGLFVEFHPDLYEAHCVLMCMAEKDGDDLRRPTVAELVVLFSRSSQKMPLTADGKRAYSFCLSMVSEALPEDSDLRKKIKRSLEGEDWIDDEENPWSIAALEQIASAMVNMTGTMRRGAS